MYLNGNLLIGKNKKYEANLLLNKANRHGLITGASGTGKTTTVKVLAESFSKAGVPVFVADIKGDVSGVAVKGNQNDNVEARIKELDLKEFEYQGFPVHFFDIYKEKGHPIRTTVARVGANILSIMLGLTDAQEGVLNLVFKIAEDENLKLVDLKDLRLVLQYIGDNRKNYITKYGNITTQSIGVIQRSLMTLENQGGNEFFKEPDFNINDFLMVNESGYGFINILDAVKLFNSPDLYASFLLWLLTELYNKMPEVGDLDKPKIVFFFDEAHLLFNDMPSFRLKWLVQIIKLIRSKGIGLYFISQSPSDIPDEVLSQLSNKIQHGLRAYTPNEIKNVKSIADSFRSNPEFKTYDEILNLKTGEALVSFLNETGEPEIVQKVYILPPESMFDAIDDMKRNKIINESILLGKYDDEIDNESAYEVLAKQIEEKEKADLEEKQKLEEEKERKLQEKEAEKQKKEEEKKKKEEEKKRKEDTKFIRSFGNKAVNSVERKIINSALKGVEKSFKNLFK